MRLLFMLALGVFLSPILAPGTEFKGVVKCDNKGESFAVVLPTGPNGAMELKKLYHGFPAEFITEKVSEVIGFVCMQHNEVVFFQHIQLAATVKTHNWKSGDAFTWEAGISKLSLSSEKIGMEIFNWSWILSDVEEIAKISKVDVDELRYILK